MKKLALGSVAFASPTPFTTFDKNGDGVLSETEFYSTQAQNMEQKASENRPMRNAGNAPVFTDVDLNKDGQITKKEFQEFQYKRRQENFSGKQ